MFAHPVGPVEAPSRRRSDCYNRTGLHYSTCYRIEDDILTRIRSLLLSRHAYRTPRTPWPTDEVHSRHQVDYDFVDSFNFNSASSVAESARVPSRLSLTSKPVQDSPYVPEMLPASRLGKRPALRRSSSTNGLHDRNRSFDGVDSTEGNQVLDDAMIHQTVLTCCPPCQPGEANKSPLGFGGAATTPIDHASLGHDLKTTSPMIVNLGLHVEEDLAQTLPRSERLFSFPGPSIRSILSKSSLHPTARTPSLETTASKIPSYRHTLLKPSVTAWQPVDLGLPVQPVLIVTPDVLPISESSEIDNNNPVGHSHQHPQVTPVEALTTLLQLPNIKGNAVEGKGSNPSDQANTKYPQFFSKVNKADVHTTSRAVPLNVCVTASSFVGESNRRAGAYQSLVPQPLVVAARTANEDLEKSTSWDNASIRNSIAVTGTQVHKHVSETPSTHPGARQQTATSLAQSPLPSARDRIADPEIFLDTASDNTGSYENLAPQELFDPQRVTIEPGGKGTGSKTRKWKPSPADYGSKYSTIPTRKSSLDQRTPASRTSSKTASPSKQFLSPLVAKAGERVQSISSKNSNSSNHPVVPDSQLSEIDGKGLVPSGKLDGRLAGRWLRDLVSENEPYVTRFTAIPPRKHRILTVTSKSIRPAETSHEDVLTARSRNKHSEPRASETFTRTINDLENLMNEALYIARQAAEREDADYIPNMLNEARAVLQSSMDASGHAGLRRRIAKKNASQSSLPSQLSANLTDARSVHESARSISSDSSSESSSMSIYISQEADRRTVPEAPYQSNVDVVNVRPTTIAHNSPTWPLGQTSAPRASTMLAGLKSIATGILTKSFDVKHPEQAVPSDPKASATNEGPAIPVSVAVPAIMNGNTEMFPQTADANHLEPFLGEQWIEEHMRSELTKSKPIGPEAWPAPAIRQPYKEDHPSRIKVPHQSKAILNRREVTEFIRVFHQPPIKSRHSSLALRKTENAADQPVATPSAFNHATFRPDTDILIQKSHWGFSLHTLSGSQGSVSEVDFSTPRGFRTQTDLAEADTPHKGYELKDSNEGGEVLPKRHISGHRLQDKLKHLKDDRLSHLNLRGKSHISLRDHKGFSLSKSHRRQPIARDWSPGRKRFVASVACISTALIGIIIGIYAGEVPSIQYYIADFSHYAILGNVLFFITLAITTFLFWPLPLLHGRKPYVLSALTIAMPLLFPQAISVSMQRSPYVATWRIALILPRTLMGAALGFANMNFMATLTDLFGASLQSSNPHQETVDEYDVRRHGGGLGVWLGIWTWCYIGSIGIGFLIGAVVINTLSPDWGFYVSIVIIAAVLLLNVVTPEVRRSTYRRSLTEVRNGTDISRRLARGEVMMHRLQTGPKWWGQELHQGVMLSLDMMRQPGFLVMSLYVAWMYGQIVLVIVVLPLPNFVTSYAPSLTIFPNCSS